jgi:thiopurine S-methyltransferase
MEPDFWHQKWKDNVIGFHKNAANPLLVNHFELFSLAKDSRVFVPLCGKTLDIAWLMANGYRVVGVELSEIAVKQLFDELALKPTISQQQSLIQYHADNIDIFVGDIFQLSKALLGEVDAVYDRAALVALPLPMRQRYTQHIIDITHGASQLLITFEYDQSLQPGPPFAISNQEINQHYQARYEINLLASEALAGGLKGQCDAVEHVWLLKKSLDKRVFDEQSIHLPSRGRWKIMLPIFILLTMGSFFAYQFNVDVKLAASGVVLAGFYTGVVSWLLSMITMVPIIGPLLVKVLTMSFIWLLNAIGYLVAYIAIKRGYSKDVLTYRGITIALMIGLVMGYVLGSL